MAKTKIQVKKRLFNHWFVVSKKGHCWEVKCRAGRVIMLEKKEAIRQAVLMSFLSTHNL